ncbi:MAG: molybdopterin-dependent oxidoreductase [Aigarchaeota archaeon]|nr:molybdopterin-dependent oxidoreductase [Aigarchaeota archaeon]MCX8192762.1 molybdopterin-dependent oxidoreductase [Nitrososphaeria archaeon]MDW7986009.1 molybdopterin-dependent oxidoreductase [Nitrososphaerota archaeon]
MTDLPPNQAIGKEWIIYNALGIPSIELDNWRLKLSGCVENPIELTYEEITSMEMVVVKDGFHCVEGWSIVDVVWEGVKIKVLAEKAGYDVKARWVIFKSVEGYSAPVPIEYALDEESIIAVKLNNKPLSIEHGFPARPIIPKVYAWKSVKWLTEIFFSKEYVEGYWEARGYHPRGDVWLEERRKNSHHPLKV